MDAELCASRVGSTLKGKWTLERLLGVGGMAAVYVARHRIGRLDAVKILHPEYARSEMVRKRFEQEAEVLNRFHHPGAVQVRDLDVTAEGLPFLVMELLEGRSLAEQIRQVPVTVEDALRIADETLDVLAAAHARGIIHRDIKPDNLFVLPNGTIKVLDFGIARLRSGASEVKTKTGTTLGTVAYMPPEQVKGQDIDVRADVYGVGATMFRLIAQRTVHEADSEVELLMKVLNEPAPRLASVVPGARIDVAQLIDRALAFDRDARYPDARSMQADVRAARNEKNGPDRPASASTRHAGPERASLAEASPSSRPPTRMSAAAVPAQPLRAWPVVARKGEVAPGILLLWLVGAGAVALLAAGAVVAALVMRSASARDDDTTPPPTAMPSATTFPRPRSPTHMSVRPGPG